MALKKGVAKLLVTNKGRTWEWPKGKVKNQDGAYVFIAGRNRRANPDIKDIEGRRFHAKDHSPVIDDDGNRVASWSVPAKNAFLLKGIVRTHYPETEIDWARFEGAVKKRRAPRAIPPAKKRVATPVKAAPTPKPETGDAKDVRVIDGGVYTLLRLPRCRAADSFINELRRSIRHAGGYRGTDMPTYSKSLNVWKIRDRYEECATDLLPTYFPGFKLEEAVAS